jgi:hypothetical protein
MTLNVFHLRTSLLLALIPMLGACTKQDSGQDAVRAAQATQRALAGLPPECTLAAPGVGAHGTWLHTAKAAPAPGPAIVNVFTFDTAVRTRALRVALNPQGLRDLEKVETRDAEGNWSDAGPISRRDAPAACEYVWLEQELPGIRQVEALRFSFSRTPGTITAANPGVLQESAGPGS